MFCLHTSELGIHETGIIRYDTTWQVRLLKESLKKTDF